MSRVRTALLGAVFFLVAGVLAAVGFALSLSLGEVPIPLGEVLASLGLGFGSSEASDLSRDIVVGLRLPRAIVAASVGCCLAVAGCLLQAVMRNPLAAPNIVGVTAGAGLGATIVLATLASAALLPVAAFVGALAAALVVYALSWHPGAGTSPVRMVLAGVAITAILTAVQTFIMLLYPERVQSVVMWMAGSLTFATSAETGFAFLWEGAWPGVSMPRGVTPYAIVGLPLAWLLAKPLDVLSLGDERAQSLGLGIERIRFAAMALASLLAAAAVSVAGLIGFVGLMVPHACRLIVGRSHAVLIPASALGGVVLMLWADLAARTVHSTPLPVGILTALLGGPYFLVLLYTARVIR